MTPSHVLSTVLVVWLASLAGLLAFRTLSGRISMSGLITVDGTKFSPERLQMLLITLGLIATYIHEALTMKTMPQPSSEIIAIFAASHAVYLGGKIARG